MTPEELAFAIKLRHGLSSLHIFDEAGAWRVFGFRAPGPFRASVEHGRGADICAALVNLDARLIEGPIHPKDSPL